jgi:hypothetical protein
VNERDHAKTVSSFHDAHVRCDDYPSVPLAGPHRHIARRMTLRARKRGVNAFFMSRDVDFISRNCRLSITVGTRRGFGETFVLTREFH